jgi:hypothetical protein
LRLFGYLFDILVKLLDVIILFTLVLLRSLGGVISGVFDFYYSALPIVTKRESNFFFGPGLYF